MCVDPISGTMMAVGAASSIGGGIMKAQGASAAGSAAGANSDFQAFLALQNAKIADQNADWEMQAGEGNAYNAGLKGRNTLATLKSGQASSGVDVNSKSFTDSRIGVENAGLQDASNVRTHAAQQYYGSKMQAWGDRTQALMDMVGGSAAQEAASKTANADLLGGAVDAVGGLAKSGFGSTMSATLGKMFGSAASGGDAVNLVPGAEVNPTAFY